MKLNDSSNIMNISYTCHYFWWPPAIV